MKNHLDSTQAAPVLGAPFSPVGFALRDYFAAMALAGIIRRSSLERCFYSDRFADAAFQAYRYADAMVGMKEIAEEADEEREPLEN